MVHRAPAYAHDRSGSPGVCGIQGGDPTGTGTGGESIYGPTFRDELHSNAQHSARGVLSMANSGKHTNASQFFVLFKSARHLDGKHTVFGRVVGGGPPVPELGGRELERLSLATTMPAQAGCV